MKFKTKEGTQKVDFLGTSNFGSDMRLSPRIRWNLKRKKVLKKSTFWGPPILVLTWGCHLESDEISKNEGAQKVDFLGTSNFGSDMRLSSRIRLNFKKRRCSKSRLSWIAKHWPVEKGPQGNLNSESSGCLQKHFTMPWTLQNDICKASPLPSIGQTRNLHKNAHVEKVLFLV